MKSLESRLLEKSIEAFIMAIEIYNKPTIKYRVEGFSFFICNAWELMLKAYMIKKFGKQGIYYSDKTDRTKSLETCISDIFTNNKDPLRLNLEKIVELRNSSTHFIVEEYEMIYIPLFQACVFNFDKKLEEFHDINIENYLSYHFLSLGISPVSFTEQEIRAKYPKDMADKIIFNGIKIKELIESNNSNFSIAINHHHYITKDKKKATNTLFISKDDGAPGTIVKEIKDPSQTHKYSTKNCLIEINMKLNKLDITPEKMNIISSNKNKPARFNSYHFNLFKKYYNLDKDEKYCYVYTVPTHPSYSYSIHVVDFIVEEIRKDTENIIERLKEKIKKGK